MSTILITGTSSGFGLETARLFLDRGWNVVATMRSPRTDVLPSSDLLKVLALDVSDAGSIARAVAEAGPVDVLVNNAGAGLMAALEGTTIESIRDLFALNTIGTIAMTRAVLPAFRSRQSGVIINVSSAVTLKPHPLLSVYTASKSAVDAFTEGLALELEPFGVRVRLVVPGRAPETPFGTTARARFPDGIPEAYAPWARQVFSTPPSQPDEVTRPKDVAEAVWQAATDPAAPMRLFAGADAVRLAREVGCAA